MKYIILPLLLLASAAITTAQSSNTYTITGHIQGFNAKCVTLSYMRNGKQIADTSMVVNNTYTFVGPANQGIAVLRKGNPTDAAGKQDVMLVYLADENFTINHKNNFANASFDNSPFNVEYAKFRAAGKAYYDHIQQLKREQDDAAAAHQDAKAKTLGDSITALNAAKGEILYGHYIESNLNSPMMVYAFDKYYLATRGHNDPNRVLALFEMLPDSVKARPTAKAFKQQITNGITYDKDVAVGKTAPDFTINDTLDHPVSLSSFRGHYVLLDFWASWCMPCRAENPNVVKQYARFHEKGFDILSVSLDQPGKKANWLKAIHDDGLTWTHVSNLKFWDDSAVKLYGVQSIPQNFLIDPQGRIVGRNLRGEELEKALAAVYKN